MKAVIIIISLLALYVLVARPLLLAVVAATH